MDQPNSIQDFTVEQQHGHAFSISSPLTVLFIAGGIVIAFVLLVVLMLLGYFSPCRKRGEGSRNMHDSLGAKNINAETELLHNHNALIQIPQPQAQHVPLQQATSELQCMISNPLYENLSSASTKHEKDMQAAIGKRSPYSVEPGASCAASISTSINTVIPAEPRHLDSDYFIRSLSVAAERVVFGAVLFRGTFGEIVTGTMCGDEDAQQEDGRLNLKIFKSGVVSDEQAHSAVVEALTLLTVPPHPNINQMLAMVVGQKAGVTPVLCYKATRYGNLKKFLQICNERRGSSASASQYLLSTQDTVYLAAQIANALVHLHQHRYVHKDLASRNCVLDDALTVQLCDTALSRDLFASEYDCLGNNENRPVRWLAPEALKRNSRFSSASDIWSFGVFMWELVTLGSIPFSDVSADEIFNRISKESVRLPQPYSCPDELYGLMYCCWAVVPESRPTAAQLFPALQQFGSTLAQYV